MFKPLTISVLAAACVAASSSAIAADWFAGAAGQLHKISTMVLRDL